MICEGDFDKCISKVFEMIKAGDRSMVVLVSEVSTGKCRLYEELAGQEELMMLDLVEWRVLMRMTMMEIWGMVCWPLMYFFGEAEGAVH